MWKTIARKRDYTSGLLAKFSILNVGIFIYSISQRDDIPGIFVYRRKTVSFVLSI